VETSSTQNTRFVSRRLSLRLRRRFAGHCRLSEARVASDLRHQFAKEAGERGPDTSGEVGIAGSRGVLESALGVVDLADNFVVLGVERRPAVSQNLECYGDGLTAGGIQQAEAPGARHQCSHRRG